MEKKHTANKKEESVCSKTVINNKVNIASAIITLLEL